MICFKRKHKRFKVKLKIGVNGQDYNKVSYKEVGQPKATDVFQLITFSN